MSSRLIAPKVGSSVDTASMKRSGSSASSSRSKTSMSARRLKRSAFALHHRLGGVGPDVAEPEHRGAVGDDRDQIAARACRCRRASDPRAISRHGSATPGRVGERQIALRGARLGGDDLDFPGAAERVVLERVLFSDQCSLEVAFVGQHFFEVGVVTNDRASSRARAGW